MRSSLLSPPPECQTRSHLRRAWWWCYQNKWLTAVASIWIQCTSGSSYAFAIYSPILKSTQSYDQSTLDSVAVFKDIGANAGLLSGLLYSSVVFSSPNSPTRGGPWVVILAGAVQCFAGYFLMWLSVTGTLARPPVALMCFYMFLAAHAQTFFNTADVVTAVENFPDHRGTAVGIMKGFLGLSGAILIQVYKTFYDDEGNDKRHLNGFSLIALMVAFYLMVIIIWENIQSLGLSTRILTFAILLLMLISLLGIAIRAQLSDSRMGPHTERFQLMDDPNPLEVEEHRIYETESSEKPYTNYDCSTYHKIPNDPGPQSSTHDRRIPQRGENLNLLQAICTGDFWLLFLAMACGMGSGLATVNNISQIGGALGYTSIETSTLVSLWSIWNFLGRFGGGYVSDYVLHSRGYPRPLFIALALATMSIGHAVIASGLPGTLYVGSVLVGICYGSQWSLMPTVTSEIFGVRHMGTIFNTISIASPVGSYILSVWVVGYIYDIEASSSDETTCTGNHCFMISFVIMAFVTFCGSLVAMVLFFRTRRFYEQIILARLQPAAAQ
ncbi:nodulin-like / Major Facilitator Superfamily protein isoform X2 [Tasmannia lanceolata]|uniref:nodulin-like / Major Facilitator Superfamily protein isoform X2 n=1 Tax=Tasmannia lanceolata TaxID=3420 RepID=UPI004062BCBD